ncbi:MAG TPA: hypothetical protein VJ866_19880 [Pyrinomonadaceae bacterium]|nr:hypothetical protein [Pyrinomonadaceae bacterium]
MKANALSRRAASLCCAALLSLCAAPLSLGGARAHTPSAPKPEGRYALDEAASDNVEAAIKEAVKHVVFYARSAVAAGLRKSTRPYRWIEIHDAEAEVSFSTDQWGAIKTTPDGKPVDWARADGEKFKVSTVWEGSDLKQTFEGKNGRRVSTYSLDADGKTLTMSVNITSGWLKQPLTYRLIYRGGPCAPPPAQPTPASGKRKKQG